MRVLRKGMNGPDVKQWQEFLLRQGFGIGTADGSFGDRTHQATAEFQRRNGLGSDGVVGPGTVGKATQLGFSEGQGGGGAPAGGGGTTPSAPAGGSSSLSEQALAQIMPSLKAEKRALFFPFLTSAMAEFEINTPARQAAFLAQLAHESGEFKWMEEIWGPTSAQRRYEPPNSLAGKLGNTQTGDGFRYKGRGPIQVTGRDNYRRYGEMLGVDLINNPQLAATPEVGFRIAGVYWKRNNINSMADRQDIVAVTKAINGGTNGLEDRKKYYERAKRVLGVSAGTRGIGGGPTRGSDEPFVRVLTRGLDEGDEPTPTAAERNAPESSTQAADAGKAAASGAAKGGAKAAAKKAAKGAAKKAAKGAAKKAAKGAAKKSGAKKSAAKKSASKKSASKKSAAKKASSKKTAAKKSASKKSAAKKGAKGGASKKGTRPVASKKSAGKGGSKKGGKGGAGRRGGR